MTSRFREEQPVGRPQAWARRGALEDGQLVPQREVFEDQGAVGPDPAEEADEDEGDHAGHHRSGRPKVNVDEADGVSRRHRQALPQYQQTRGTLAMLAQWISLAAQDGFRKARAEPLITLGSAPLSEPGFRSVVLGQLGESRLVAAIDTDIAGEQAHSEALDADTKGPLRDIHRRVGTAILFESSGGQTDKVAHLPELRFALGEPDLDTTSIDNAAFTLEGRSVLCPQGGLGRIPHRLPADDEEGRERPACVAR